MPPSLYVDSITSKASWSFGKGSQEVLFLDTQQHLESSEFGVVDIHLSLVVPSPQPSSKRSANESPHKIVEQKRKISTKGNIFI